MYPAMQIRLGNSYPHKSIYSPTGKSPQHQNFYKTRYQHHPSSFFPHHTQYYLHYSPCAHPFSLHKTHTKSSKTALTMNTPSSPDDSLGPIIHVSNRRYYRQCFRENLHPVNDPSAPGPTQIVTRTTTRTRTTETSTTTATTTMRTVTTEVTIPSAPHILIYQDISITTVTRLLP